MLEYMNGIYEYIHYMKEKYQNRGNLIQPHLVS